MRYFSSELVLQLARRGRRAPAPAFNPAGGVQDIAKSIIAAGGLGALWAMCCEPSQMAGVMALDALSTLLGSAAAMSRSVEAAEAVLALVSDGAVGRLARDHVDPALAVLAGSPDEPRGASAETAISRATSALLALHYLAANPDPAVHGLFVAAAGVDGGGGTAMAAGGAWSMILSSVDTAADGRAGHAFLEAALLAAGSVCGAPPLPVPGVAVGGAAGSTGNSAGSAVGGTKSNPDDLVRILPAYDARARGPTCLAVANVATSRGLATRAVALLENGGVSTTRSRPAPSATGVSRETAAADATQVGRAAIRVVWALSRGPSAAIVAADGALARLMDLFSARRAGGGGAALGSDAASGVLVLESIAAFLSLEDKGDNTAGTSPETTAAMSRAVGELCELVLDGSATNGVDVGTATVASLGPRSLDLLATAAANPRLRPLLVDHPRFPAVLDLLLTERHLDTSSSVSGV